VRLSRVCIVELSPTAVEILDRDDVLDETRVHARALEREAEKRCGFELEVVHHGRAVLEDRSDSAVHFLDKPVRHGQFAPVVLYPGPCQ